jgi:hypothetical protein
VDPGVPCFWKDSASKASADKRCREFAGRLEYIVCGILAKDDCVELQNIGIADIFGTSGSPQLPKPLRNALNFQFWNVAVLILSGVFFLLLTSWMLWWWLVGESRDIRWMRNWFATFFVVMAALMCFGAGAWLTHCYEEARYRRLVVEFSQLLEERLAENRPQDVRDALIHVNSEPDEWSSFSRDRLIRVTEVTEALRKSSRRAVAEKSSGERSVH